MKTAAAFDSVRMRDADVQLGLIGAALLGALAVAIAMATQRPFFEGLVREKYVEPSSATIELADRLRAPLPDAPGAADPTPPDLTPESLEALYGLFMRGDEADAALARALVECVPDVVTRRVERTLLAGSDQQFERALELCRAAPDPAFGEVLSRARARALRRADAERAARVESTFLLVRRSR